MDLREFKPLYNGTAGPRLTAGLDVTRDNEAGAEEVALRWRGLRDELADVPAELLDAAEDHLLQETGAGGTGNATWWSTPTASGSSGCSPGAGTPLRTAGRFPDSATW